MFRTRTDLPPPRPGSFAVWTPPPPTYNLRGWEGFAVMAANNKVPPDNTSSEPSLADRVWAIIGDPAAAARIDAARATDAASVLQSQRAALVAEIAAIRAAAARDWKADEAAIAQAETTAHHQRAIADRAEENLRAARHARAVHGQTAAASIARLEARLRQTGDPGGILRATADQLDAMLESERRVAPTV